MYSRARSKSTRKPTRKLRGSGKVLEWIKRAAPKVNAFLKNTKLISRIGDAGINYVPGQYRGLADSSLARGLNPWATDADVRSGAEVFEPPAAHSV